MRTTNEKATRMPKITGHTSSDMPKKAAATDPPFKERNDSVDAPHRGTQDYAYKTVDTKIGRNGAKRTISR